jgi:hypothetical protein
MVIGAMIIEFSLIKGKVKRKFGYGWLGLWPSDRLPEQQVK